MSDELVKDDQKEYPTPPPGIRVLKNGAGFDMATKRIAHGPGTYAPDIAPITKENNADFQAKRWEKARESARQAIASGTASTDVFGGWFTVVAAQTQLALDVRQGRASTEAAKFIGRAADVIPDRAQTLNATQTNVQINVTRDTLLDILSTTGGQTIDIDE